MVCVCGGLTALARYANRPGIAAAAPPRWPTASRLERRPDRATLVMLLHPGCPCSRASVAELDRLMSRSGRLVTAHVLFLKPREVPDGWERTDLWQQAAAIPGVHVWRDDDGVEANGFGASTSGQVLVYDASGHLVFSGGITPARGHEGDNDGVDSVVALLTGRGAPTAAHTPVFGCSLRDPGNDATPPSVVDGL
jgi:hypothetical protein